MEDRCILDFQTYKGGSCIGAIKCDNYVRYHDRGRGTVAA
jgi:hypothetical protein